MSSIQFTATFPSIPAHNLAAFKEVAARLMAATRTEAGNLQYDWFFSDDETQCVVREAYVDSDAVFVHSANVGELIGEMGDIGGDMRVEAFGDLSDQLRDLMASMDAAVYRPFQST
jgi:quinol monooxygenase YgiN